MAERHDPLARSCGSLCTCKWTGSDSIAIKGLKSWYSGATVTLLQTYCAFVSNCCMNILRHLILCHAFSTLLIVCVNCCATGAHTLSKGLWTCKPKQRYSCKTFRFGEERYNGACSCLPTHLLSGCYLFVMLCMSSCQRHKVRITCRLLYTVRHSGNTHNTSSGSGTCGNCSPCCAAEQS